jgi:hypothetical protein
MWRFFFQSQKSLCWIRQPFFLLSPGCENSPQKKRNSDYVLMINELHKHPKDSLYVAMFLLEFKDDL